MESAKQKIADKFMKEEELIKREQERLNQKWETELDRRTESLGSKSDAIDSMFEGNFANQWNEKAKGLMNRKEENERRFEDLI
jgi:transketolase